MQTYRSWCVTKNTSGCSEGETAQVHMRLTVPPRPRPRPGPPPPRRPWGRRGCTRSVEEFFHPVQRRRPAYPQTQLIEVGGGGDPLTCFVRHRDPPGLQYVQDRLGSPLRSPLLSPFRSPLLSPFRSPLPERTTDQLGPELVVTHSHDLLQGAQCGRGHRREHIVTIQRGLGSIEALQGHEQGFEGIFVVGGVRGQGQHGQHRMSGRHALVGDGPECVQGKDQGTDLTTAQIDGGGVTSPKCRGGGEHQKHDRALESVTDVGHVTGPTVGLPWVPPVLGFGDDPQYRYRLGLLLVWERRSFTDHERVGDQLGGGRSCRFVSVTTHTCVFGERLSPGLLDKFHREPGVVSDQVERALVFDRRHTRNIVTFRTSPQVKSVLSGYVERLTVPPRPRPRPGPPPPRRPWGGPSGNPDPGRSASNATARSEERRVGNEGEGQRGGAD